jgi:hypothetical protein
MATLHVGRLIPLVEPLYKTMPYGLVAVGLSGIVLAPPFGKIGGALLLGVGLVIYQQRHRMQPRKLIRSRRTASGARDGERKPPSIGRLRDRLLPTPGRLPSAARGRRAKCSHRQHAGAERRAPRRAGGEADDGRFAGATLQPAGHARLLEGLPRGVTGPSAPPHHAQARTLGRVSLIRNVLVMLGKAK